MNQAQEVANQAKQLQSWRATTDKDLFAAWDSPLTPENVSTFDQAVDRRGNLNPGNPSNYWRFMHEEVDTPQLLETEQRLVRGAACTHPPAQAHPKHVRLSAGCYLQALAVAGSWGRRWSGCCLALGAAQAKPGHWGWIRGPCWYVLQPPPLCLAVARPAPLRPVQWPLLRRRSTRGWFAQTQLTLASRHTGGTAIACACTCGTWTAARSSSLVRCC